jgi:hypothetical protein
MLKFLLKGQVIDMGKRMTLCRSCKEIYDTQGVIFKPRPEDEALSVSCGVCSKCKRRKVVKKYETE